MKTILHQYGIKNCKKRLSYLRARFYVVEVHRFNNFVLCMYMLRRRSIAYWLYTVPDSQLILIALQNIVQAACCWVGLLSMSNWILLLNEAYSKSFNRLWESRISSERMMKQSGFFLEPLPVLIALFIDWLLLNFVSTNQDSNFPSHFCKSIKQSTRWMALAFRKLSTVAPYFLLSAFYYFLS